MPTFPIVHDLGADADGSLRAALIERFRGQPGPTGADREEHLKAYTGVAGPMVIVETTRPATIADLLDSGRPVLTVQESAGGEYIRAILPDDEYRYGGCIGGLRRKSGMTDEQRAAAGERLQASRNRVEA